MKITKGYAELGHEGAPKFSTTPYAGVPNHVPVVIIAEADFERIMAALREFTSAHEPKDHRRLSIFESAHMRRVHRAADILKEIGG